jgi:hypothetical protein
MKTTRKRTSPRSRPSFKADKRSKHHHWQVTIFYGSGATFARTYTDHKKATAYAKPQKRSSMVKMVRVVKVS